MSLISRMLRDLEAREASADSPRDAGDTRRRFTPGPERRGRRRVGARLRRANGFLLALALALVAVAAALWWQRGPDLLALVGPYVSDADAPTTAELDAPEPPPARLAGARFRGSGDEARLELTLAGEPREQPGYARRGTALAVRLPAPADGVSMPDPPDDQRVFVSAELQADGDRGSTIRLKVAEGARFDLDRDAGRLTLVGRVPAAPPAPDIAEARPADAEAAAATRESGDGEAREVPVPRSAEPEAPGGDGGPAVATVDEAAVGEAAKRSGGPADDERVAASAPPPADAHSGVHKEDRSSPEVRAQRRYREARQAYSAGDVGRTRRLLRSVLELDADLHGARDLLASLYRRTGDADAARDVLAEGLQRAPRRLNYAKPYARLLVDAGELNRAARVLDQASGADNDDADFHALTAAVAQRRGRHEEAASAYTRALELDGGNGRWWLGLGVALAAADHPGEAAVAFREARRAGDLTPRLDDWARGRIRALAEENG